MVDLNTYTDTLIINQFNGLNLRDNQDYLPLGDTVRAKNIDSVASRSLTKKKGITSLYSDATFTPGIAWRNADFYYDKREVPYYIGVSYPFINLITPPSGFVSPIFSSLNSMGEGHFIKGIIGDMMWVDGANPPVYINDGVATSVTWPPTYTNDNSSILNESINAQAANPTTFGTDIGYPSLGVFFEGRWYLAGDKLAPQRLYASKIRSTNFSDNTASSRINVAFFVDILTNSPITALKVINNKFLMIFCRNEIHVLTGKFPPTAVTPQPHIQINSLNPDIGCIGRYAFAEKGNNDLFFISNRQSLYTLTTTENFQDVRPYGLSEKIYPVFRDISIERASRARLINDNLKGELQLWFPADDQTYYPNKRYIYDYSENPQEAQWTEDTGFPLSLRGAFIDRAKNRLILVDRDKLLEDDTGTTYDGEPIELEYEIAPQDFGKRDQLKEVVKVEISYRLENATAATVFFSHIWDNGKKSGVKRLDLAPVSVAKFGSSKFGSAVYASNAGNPIDKVEFEMINPIGKILKILLECSTAGDLTIVDLKLRYKTLSKTGV